jgi:Rrf2 family iron-sulfur cluster assembly transcriptional regulator
VLLLAARGTRAVVPVGEIAGALGVPRNYLGKTLQRLVRRGVLKSVRGPGGGFVLAREANTLPISAVVGEFDTLEQDGRCMLGDAACDLEHPCAAHARWTAWSMAMAGLLDGTTVGELIGEDAGAGTERNEVSA